MDKNLPGLTHKEHITSFVVMMSIIIILVSAISFRPLEVLAFKNNVNLPEFSDRFTTKADYSRIHHIKQKQHKAFQQRLAMLTSDTKTAAMDDVSRFVSGTGFFVDSNYIITNQHVVDTCDHIRIRGAVQPSYAKVYAIDRQNDLAILRTTRASEHVAPIRQQQIVKVGEAVTIMGYPLEHGITGDYVVKSAKVTDVSDTYGSGNRIQFTDSVEKGNSGGPLLDAFGRVTGVIVGKMSFYLASNNHSAQSKPIKTASVAINLPTLERFLDKHRIYTKKATATTQYSKTQMETQAKQYIVNIHCVKTPTLEAEGKTPKFPDNNITLVRN